MRWQMIGAALIGLGCLLVVAGIGTAGYAAWADWRHAAHASIGPADALPSRVDDRVFDSVRAAAPPRATLRPTPAFPPPTLQTRPGLPVLVPPFAVPTQTAVPTPTTAPTPVPQFGPAVWMAIPKLKLSVTITDVGVEQGEYVVPAWDVGHQDDSANPGDSGNAVFNGHVETINAGHVFAGLKDLEAGDGIYTYTQTQRLTWVVRETKVVPNTDVGFLAPTEDTRITLYTCTGTWLPLARDYSHRLVVVGELVGVDARS